MAEYLVVACGCGCLLQTVSVGDMEIINTAASDASDMIVRRGIPIETFLPPLDLHLLDEPGSGQKTQVSVHRAQCDMRQPFSDHVVDFICGGVHGHLSKLLQYDRSLIGEADFLRLVQGTP